MTPAAAEEGACTAPEAAQLRDAPIDSQGYELETNDEKPSHGKWI